MIREVCEKDLLPLLELYMYLHEDNIPAENEHLILQSQVSGSRLNI